MKEQTKIISPIAIDMGAKNTGVYLNHFVQGEDPTTSGNIAGKTIVIDSSSITWSQVNRTQKRHQVRNNKRRKLAKRLLKLILEKEYDVNPDLKQSEYLNGLLNRRGYNRIETTEEQAEILQTQIVSDFFQPFIFKDSTNDDLLHRLSDEIIIKDEKSEQNWKDFLKGEPFSLSGKQNPELKAWIKDKKDITDKDEVAELSKAFTAIKNLIEKQIDNYKTGHLHRKNYLENIEKDIENSDTLKPLLANDLTAEKLACLIGNISNLQLRILRKYFNDKAMKSGDQWKPEELHKLFFKWVRSWHAKQNDEKENRKALLELKEKDILAVFTTSDPKLSIPPYEDQNNRRPPKDLTLRLKPEGLDHSSLTNWEAITQLLSDKYIAPQTDPHVTEKINIAEGLKDNVRIQKNSGETEERQILADTLHRILDRTIVLDPYKLRWLAQGGKTPEANKAKEWLNKRSNNQAENIIVFAKNYYAEVDIAKQGLWTEDNSLFFRCETNPPHKGNIQHRLVGHILRCDFKLNSKTKKSEELEEFKEKCWNKKIRGNATTKSLAGKIEETRKEYGNAFNYISKTIQRRQYVLRKETKEITPEQKNRWEKYEHDYKDIVDAIEYAEVVATEIDSYFKSQTIRCGEKEKYNNPYSIAQLYNHLETEIGGFSKTDQWNTEENAWRDKEQTIEVLSKAGKIVKATASNASRLTADSIRPFDGMLDRIISRQAYEIARMKIKQIEGLNEKLNIDENDTLFVPIFMEQNRFAFEQSLHEIKGKNNVKKEAKDRVEKGLENQEKQWQDKKDRIKKNQYCPYTGENITKGEIDHIIPQSESKHHGDVVFNSEANLIYCSSNGNNQKGNNRYSFDQLNPQYLEEVFRISNNVQIQQDIKDFVNGLDENDAISFHNLETEKQNYLRHALFIRDLDSKTFPLLNTRYKTLVNGTQGYLGKQIRKLLQEKYPKVEVKTYQINAQEVSQLRTILGEYDEDLKKSDRQGAFSHVVDASLVLATALQNVKIAEELTTTNTAELSEKGEWLKDLLPNNVDVLHIKRRPKYRKKLASTQIFKEGLYGERFMSILLSDEKLFYGFALNNCHEIHPLKKPKKGINNFAKKLQTSKEEQQKKQNKYFESLKPFLYTGSTKKKNKKPVSGSLSDNQQKYIYLSIDKTKALTHLQKCAKEVCGDVEIKQAEQLEELRYSVEKKEIKGVLLTGQTTKSFIQQLDDKKLKVSDLRLPAKSQWEQLIRHPIKDYGDNETTLAECFGKLEQVEIDNPKLGGFWERLSEQSGLEIDELKKHLLKKNDKGELAKKSGIVPKTVFNNKLKLKENDSLKSLENNELLQESFGLEFKIKTDLIPQTSWDKLFKELFLRHKPKNTTEYIERENRKNKDSHHKVRKKYSLPVVSAPSGGFRIKRENPLTGETVYQVSGIEGFATKGYDETLKTPVLIDELAKSANIAPLDGRQKQMENVCYFDEWKDINLTPELAKKITSLSYSIGSKDRFNIRVSMDFVKFKNLDETINHFVNIPAEVKEPKKNDNWKFKKTSFQAYFSSQLLGKPRSNLFIEKVSAGQIIFSYIVESTNGAMKKAYQNGTPAE